MTRWVLASVFAVLLLLSGTGGAQVTSHIGTITAYHLNADALGRGPCIQTEPAAPTTWICLYRASPLYDELRETLRQADQLKWECLFGWTTLDGAGFAMLTVLECASLL
jgi:hypothetical protein